MDALHGLIRPRRSTKRYQYNFSAALRADAGIASHRPSEQLISHGRSPIGTFTFERTVIVHYVHAPSVPFPSHNRNRQMSHQICHKPAVSSIQPTNVPMDSVALGVPGRMEIPYVCWSRSATPYKE